MIKIKIKEYSDKKLDNLLYNIITISNLVGSEFETYCKPVDEVSKEYSDKLLIDMKNSLRELDNMIKEYYSYYNKGSRNTVDFMNKYPFPLNILDEITNGNSLIKLYLGSITGDPDMILSANEVNENKHFQKWVTNIPNSNMHVINDIANLNASIYPFPLSDHLKEFYNQVISMIYSSDGSDLIMKDLNESWEKLKPLRIRNNILVLRVKDFKTMINISKMIAMYHPDCHVREYWNMIFVSFNEILEK